MDWLRHGKNWPNAQFSRFVTCEKTRWHVQSTGTGPDILLLHGSGATTHSFADMFAPLAQNFSVTAIDLPGHGFSSPIGNRRPSLRNVASAVSALMEQESIAPQIIVGHSAGAAIAVQCVSDGGLTPQKLVSINGAFYPFPGFAGSVFPIAARLLFLNPFVPKLFSFGAGNYSRVENLIRSTGSKLSTDGVRLYQSALQSSDHVDGALALMAHWNLEPMAEMLSKLTLPTLQIIGMSDGTVSPEAASRTEKLLQFGHRHNFSGKGHLVHEEEPDEVARLISEFALNDPSSG